MGLLDFVKKMATGASDEDNRKNKARMREIFNSLVSDGDDYKLGPFARKSRLRDALQY